MKSQTHAEKIAARLLQTTNPKRAREISGFWIDNCLSEEWMDHLVQGHHACFRPSPHATLGARN